MEKNLTTLKSEFAKACAEAYVNQYMLDNKVSGTPVIVYDSNGQTFAFQSSGSPMLDSEVEITTIDKGDYGDLNGCDAETAKAAIEEMITMNADDEWLFDAINGISDIDY